MDRPSSLRRIIQILLGTQPQSVEEQSKIQVIGSHQSAKLTHNLSKFRKGQLLRDKLNGNVVEITGTCHDCGSEWYTLEGYHQCIHESRLVFPSTSEFRRGMVVRVRLPKYESVNDPLISRGHNGLAREVTNVCFQHVHLSGLDGFWFLPTWLDIESI